MNFSRPRTAEDLIAYYLESLSTKDSKGLTHSLANWIGSGCPKLGISGPVTVAKIRDLLNGIHPNSKQALVQNAMNRAQAATEWTIEAPKEFSVIFALAGRSLRRKLLRAFDRSVRAIIKHAESQYGQSRKGHGGKAIVPAMFVGIGFLEYFSRAGDSHLHYNALLSVGLRDDGTTGAIWNKELFTNRSILHSRFIQDLAKRTEKLGFFVIRDLHTFRIKGLEPELVKAHSSRRTAIEMHMRERGTSGRYAAQIASFVTRPKKAQEPIRAALIRWKEQARSLGWTPERLSNMRFTTYRTHADPEHHKIDPSRSPNLLPWEDTPLRAKPTITHSKEDRNKESARTQESDRGNDSARGPEHQKRSTTDAEKPRKEKQITGIGVKIDVNRARPFQSSPLTFISKVTVPYLSFRVTGGVLSERQREQLYSVFNGSSRVVLEGVRGVLASARLVSSTARFIREKGSNVLVVVPNREEAKRVQKYSKDIKVMTAFELASQLKRSKLGFHEKTWKPFHRSPLETMRDFVALRHLVSNLSDQRLKSDITLVISHANQHSARLLSQITSLAERNGAKMVFVTGGPQQQRTQEQTRENTHSQSQKQTQQQHTRTR